MFCIAFRTVAACTPVDCLILTTGVNRALNVHRTIRLIRDGMGGGEIIYLSLHCHHHKDSCVKMGSDERHFNV